jgi:hypothetical protein
MMSFPMHSPFRFSLGVLTILFSHAAWSADPALEIPVASVPAHELEVNNRWSVTISNSMKLNAPLYVTLKRAGNHWDIVELFDAPPKLKRSQDLELFMATRDFQQWTNFYMDMRTDCDKFEVRESDFHSVCTSSFTEKKAGMAVVGLFFGGSGKVAFAYTNDRVKAAINSIRPQQAVEILTTWEQRTLNSQKQVQVTAARQQTERHQSEEALVAARKTAPIGAKDWCEQTVKYLGMVMQVEQTYTCKNYGVLNEDNLRNEGWSIINKQARQVGYVPQTVTVYDISIEKVPR